MAGNFGSGIIIGGHMTRSPSQFLIGENEDDDFKSSMLSGSAAADVAPGYEVDEDALLYDKNLKKGDKNYQLFTLR